MQGRHGSKRLADVQCSQAFAFGTWNTASVENGIAVAGPLDKPCRDTIAARMVVLLADVHLTNVACEVGAAGQVREEDGVKSPHVEDAIVNVVRNNMFAEVATTEGQGEKIWGIGDEGEDLEEELIWEMKDRWDVRLLRPHV